MILRCEPIFLCLDNINTSDAYIILLSPEGTKYNQGVAKRISKDIKHLIIICGHYEGIDARILEYIDEEISIGDYVLTGGEIPACALVDAISRLIPGVIGDESRSGESFTMGLLEYPQYTRPAIYDNKKVPDILLSGHHANIEKWRHEKSLERTKKYRPDLYETYVKEHPDEFR